MYYPLNVFLNTELEGKIEDEQSTVSFQGQLIRKAENIFLVFIF